MQATGAPEGEACYTCGEASSACACAMLDDDRRSLCQMSDSARSYNEGDSATTACQETWLVQEYCSLGTLQVQRPLKLIPTTKWKPLPHSSGLAHVHELAPYAFKQLPEPAACEHRISPGASLVLALHARLHASAADSLISPKPQYLLRSWR